MMCMSRSVVEDLTYKAEKKSTNDVTSIYFSCCVKCVAIILTW